MVAVIFAFLYMIGLNAGVTQEWKYSQAVSQVQNNDLDDAQSRLSELLVDQPDNPELLYDSGVVAYKKKEFEKAVAYFSQTLKSNKLSSALKKQAHFNLGNANVGLKKFKEAIQQYREVLQIDPQHERAKHNLEKVLQMMQQEQNNQEQNQDQQDSEQDQKNDDSNGSDGSKENQNQKQDGDSSQDSSSGNEQEKQKSQEQKDGNKQNQSSDKSNSNNGTQEQDELGNNHTSSSKSQTDTKEQTKQKSDEGQAVQAGSVADKAEQDKQELEKQFAGKDAWMGRVLERREQRDEQASKQMIKATIDANGSGHHDNYNW